MAATRWTEKLITYFTLFNCKDTVLLGSLHFFFVGPTIGAAYTEGDALTRRRNAVTANSDGITLVATPLDIGASSGYFCYHQNTSFTTRNVFDKTCWLHSHKQAWNYSIGQPKRNHYRYGYCVNICVVRSHQLVFPAKMLGTVRHCAHSRRKLTTAVRWSKKGQDVFGPCVIELPFRMPE
jgi:hypothetical protein